MSGKERIALLAAAAALTAAPAFAQPAETIAYRYDARGRLVEVKRTDAAGQAVTTTYSYDKAGNRTVKTTAGSPNPPPP